MVTHIVLPSFVQNVLKRNKLPLSTIADFNKVRELLSINDIVLIQTLNRSEHWKTLLGVNVVEAQNFWYGSDMSLYDLWYNSATEENKTYLVNILSVLVESGQANDEIAERLFNNKENTPAQELENSYEIIDIGPKYYGLLLEPGVFPNRDLSNKLVKDLLRSMYLYCSQAEVARTELFKLYMSRL